MKLPYTRAMITAALEGKLEHENFHAHPVFGMLIPEHCAGVPDDILDPRSTWIDKNAYDTKSKELAGEFIKNFEKYAAGVTDEILQSAPRI
jgi:phosphoenolpyruvate carboxykinase (ATP)